MSSLPLTLRPLAVLALLFLTLTSTAQAQSNSEFTTWVGELRNVQPDPARIAQVSDLTLQRDEGSFHFASGTLHLLQPVRGRTVGAVFVGEGMFRVNAPIPVEQAQIRRLLGTVGVEQPFRTAVLFFTDLTEQELTGSLAFGAGAPAPDAGREVIEALKYLSDAGGWIAEDFATPMVNQIPGFFYAHVAQDRGDPLMFVVNPTDFEEVGLLRRMAGGGDRREVIASFHRRAEYETGTSLPQEALDLVRVDGYDVEAWIENDLDFRARALVRLTPLAEHRWIPFTLHPALHVDSVRWSDGKEVLAHRAGASGTLWIDLDSAPEGPMELTMTYQGEILAQERGLWVAVADHHSWLPLYQYGRLIPYRVTFHTAERLRVASLGTRVSETRADGVVTTVWETPPLRGMTFNVGRFEEHRPEDPGRTLLVQVDEGAHRRLGTMADDANMMLLQQDDMAAAVADDVTRAFRFFDAVYGEAPVRDFIASEIPYSHGEAFEGLVLLSWATFQNTSSQGFDEMFRAHEVAHQWWGIGVRPATYRDQWLGEGFSEFSGLWYAARVQGDVEMYMKRLRETREAIIKRGPDVAPISLGPRVANAENPRDHQLIIYEKGAWVLHMLRSMLMDHESGSDALFDRIIKAFYSERFGRAANTEHFRAIVERELGSDMGWFFDQWVHGSAIPKYTFAYQLEDRPNGAVKARIRVRQEGVPDDFRMIVPIQLDFGSAGTAIVRVDVNGPLTEQDLPLLPQRPQTVQLNPAEAVLAEVETEDW